MVAPQNFRSAFHGFNREDVVNYIEYLNNRYTSQLDQLNNQLQEAKNSVSPQIVMDLQTQLDAALQRCAELEAQLNRQQEDIINRELEAYRRAESTERMAHARAQKIYDTAYAAITDASAVAQSATGEFSEVAQRTVAQLQAYQDSVATTVASFQSAAEAIKSLKPKE